jgi:hypothetical protein
LKRNATQKINRRDFIIGSSGILLLGCTPNKHKKPAGELLGPDYLLGHKLRDGKFPSATREMQVPILIAGAGIAGLSCGWWLQRNGISDFKLLELESVAGGNSRSGQNSISAFPWGAHYLPLPGLDASYVRILLAELGVLQGDINAIAPHYDETMLVQAPDERLFINGSWQDGLIPKSGIGATAKREIQQFESLMNDWSARKGDDGRFAFTIPADLSSTDSSIRALDKITFHEWVLQQNLESEPLHWYLSYCCRDDFGADHKHISAWAGLHYFCCRRGQASNAETNSVLTAPQGNGWIVEQLSKKLEHQLLSGHTVVRLESKTEGLVVDVYDNASKEVVRVHCNQLVWAAPLMVLKHVWAEMPKITLPDYAPWLVANLTINNIDEQEFTTWDNVIFQGKGLGYVDACHQQMKFNRPQRVLTYYRALSHSSPQDARKELLATTHESWSAQIFADLHKAHPHLENQCSAIDIWRWPHAMAIPTPGFLSSLATRQQRYHPNMHFAHSDLSGFSLFEEAQYWGVIAAKKIMGVVG